MRRFVLTGVASPRVRFDLMALVAGVVDRRNLFNMIRGSLICNSEGEVIIEGTR